MHDFYRWLIISSSIVAVCICLYRIYIQHATSLYARRASLLLIIIGALVLPFIKVQAPAFYTLNLDLLTGYSGSTLGLDNELAPIDNSFSTWSWLSLAGLFYWVITGILFLRFLSQILGLLRQKQQGVVVQQNGYN